MQQLDGQVVLSPTDLTHHQECRHLTWLDLGVSLGLRPGPEVETSEELQLVFDRGIEHEKKYLASLVAAGKSVAEIGTVFDLEGRRQAEAETLAAMRSGVDVVYQGTFFDGAWGGQADFLLRVETPSISARGPTRSPTPSSPARSRWPRCCRWPSTPSGSPCCRAGRRSG